VYETMYEMSLGKQNKVQVGPRPTLAILILSDLLDKGMHPMPRGGAHARALTFL
jgi:hypothetical protein